MSIDIDNVYIEPKVPSIPKRIAAFFIDLVICLLLFTGIAFVVGEAVGYTTNYEMLQEKYIDYGVGSIDPETNEFIFCEVEKEECKQSYELFFKDEEAMVYYDKSIELTTLILTISVFVTYLATEFIVPLFIKERSTIGMLLFKIGLVSTDGTKVEHKQLFIRFLFGKFLLATMIPIYGMIFSFFSAFGGIFGLIFALIIWGIDIGLTLFSEKKAGIANSLGSCYAYDIETGMVYDTIEEINAIKGAVAAKKANKEKYF